MSQRRKKNPLSVFSLLASQRLVLEVPFFLVPVFFFAFHQGAMMGKDGLIRVEYLFLGVRSVHESKLFGLVKTWESADRAPDGADFFLFFFKTTYILHH